MKEEKNKIPESIRTALLTLLKRKDYADIFMTEIAQQAHVGRRTLYRYFPTKDDIMRYEADTLMEAFSQKVLELQSAGLQNTLFAWFTFWEEHIESLALLKKSHLLYFIEDNLPKLIMKVALMTKYRGMDIDLDGAVAAAPVSELYEFYFELAGIWKLTLLWMDEKERKSPEEMSEIITKIWEA
ncbi:MAG: TetR/AcrR family transcriptional regulator [Clostridia bacterium]|nr:TetR/AcrR family transcriptional regulator [Clostridia bacterium]